MITDTPAVTVFGIKNCDTVKKACRWLDENQVRYHFHDFRKDGLTVEKIIFWLEKIPAETLLNKRGTTWRKLDSANQHRAETAELAVLLMEQPTLIKRPVLECDNQVNVGFSAKQFADFLNKTS